MDKIPGTVKFILCCDALVLVSMFFIYDPVLDTSKDMTLTFHCLWLSPLIAWAVMSNREYRTEEYCYNKWIRGTFIAYTIATVILLLVISVDSLKYRGLLIISVIYYIIMLVLDMQWKSSIKEKILREQIRNKMDDDDY